MFSQMAYVSENRLQPRSRESIKELEKFRDEFREEIKGLKLKTPSTLTQSKKQLKNQEKFFFGCELLNVFSKERTTP